MNYCSIHCVFPERVTRRLAPSKRDFDAAETRADDLQAEILKPRYRNPPTGDGGPNHWELWLRDPDGYTVVLASPDGSAGIVE